MEFHQVKTAAHTGTDYAEIYPYARKLYNKIKSQTKRRPYVRSSYFNKDKVFIELFWIHLNQKNAKQRNKRLGYYGCGIELLRNTRQSPTTKTYPNKSSEILYRFGGITPNGERFYIQVKENIRTKRKDLISVFPWK